MIEPTETEKRQLDAQPDESLRVGSLVVVGTKRGTFVAKVRKITKRDIVIRPISRPVR